MREWFSCIAPLSFASVVAHRKLEKHILAHVSLAKFWKMKCRAGKSIGTSVRETSCCLERNLAPRGKHDNSWRRLLPFPLPSSVSLLVSWAPCGFSSPSFPYSIWWQFTIWGRPGWWWRNSLKFVSNRWLFNYCLTTFTWSKGCANLEPVARRGIITSHNLSIQ